MAYDEEADPRKREPGQKWVPPKTTEHLSKTELAEVLRILRKYANCKCN